VYHIDHYLGKETVQNLLVFCFANPVFGASWNRNRLDRVEITVAESAGVGSRARCHDRAGAVRDMLQSHLTQVPTLIAMEAPVSMAADDLRTEKVKVLRSIRPLDPARLVLGQSEAGITPGGQLAAYRDLEGVGSGSRTASYAAATLFVDNWRWQGVPFHLRTGKAMADRRTQVAVTFRPPPVCLYHGISDQCVAHPDVLCLNPQPDEGFKLEIEVKEPGDTSRLHTGPPALRLRRRFRPHLRGLRDPPARHHGGRPDAVRPGGRGGEGVAPLRLHPRRRPPGVLVPGGVVGPVRRP
jgi:glucose-6-phosphate 1-dehydrogenase